MRKILGWSGWLAWRGAKGGAIVGAGYGALMPIVLLVLNGLGLLVWPFSYLDVTIATFLLLVAGALGGAGLGAVLALLAGLCGALITWIVGRCSRRLISLVSILFAALGALGVCLLLDLPDAYHANWDEHAWSAAGWILGLGLPVLLAAVAAWRISRQERTPAYPRQ